MLTYSTYLENVNTIGTSYHCKPFWTPWKKNVFLRWLCITLYVARLFNIKYKSTVRCNSYLFYSPKPNKNMYKCSLSATLKCYFYLVKVFHINTTLITTYNDFLKNILVLSTNIRKIANVFHWWHNDRIRDRIPGVLFELSLFYMGWIKYVDIMKTIGNNNSLQFSMTAAYYSWYTSGL